MDDKSDAWQELINRAAQGRARQAQSPLSEQRKFFEPSLLINLPPTQVLQHQAELTFLKYGSSKRASDIERVRNAEEMVLVGKRRDQMVEERGCWCLGLGGRYPEMIPGYDENGPYATYREFCTCKTGANLKLRRDAYLIKLKSAQAQRKIQKLLGSLDMSRYHGQTLVTYLSLVRAVAGEAALEGAAVTVALLSEWCMQNTRPLVVSGDFGVGKTGLLISCMFERSNTGNESQVIVTAPDLMDQIKSTVGGKGPISYTEITGLYKTVDVLYLDEMGTEMGTDYEAVEFWKILNYRYSTKRLTAFSTNIQKENLPKAYETGVVQRILEDAIYVRIPGPILRRIA